MRFYAIKQKSTGHFLPQGNLSRGFTFTEPDACLAGPPRLFAKRTSAAAALRCWLQGHWESHGDYDRGDWGNEAYRVIEKKPRASRQPEDFEVVELSLDES